MLRVCLVILAIFAGFLLNPVKAFDHTAITPERRSEAQHWADSVYQALSPEKRIAQLMMVAAYSNRGEGHKQKILNLVNQYGVGGLIFFQGKPTRQLQLTNTYQNNADVPLLIGMDAEWGMGMRLNQTMDFPRQMTLGAVQDHSLIKRMGRHIGQQCRRIGVHINFAPVVDVNSNPQNPVIHMRSFGEIPEQVAERASAYLDGLQQAGVMGVAKHFPGHGDTDRDSHKALPVLDQSRKELQRTELYPFRRMIKEHAGGIMSGHLAVPSMTGSDKAPASLSPKMIQGYLRDSLGYQNLVFTDALNMQGVTDQYGPARVAVKALQAGNDILLYPEAVPQAIKRIQFAVQNQAIDTAMLRKRVKKVLRAKYYAGLSEFNALAAEGVQDDLHSPEALDVKHQLAEGAMTLVKDPLELVPLKDLSKVSIASLAIGGSDENAFQDRLGQYADVRQFHLPHDAGAEAFSRMKAKLKDYNRVILSVHGQSFRVNQNFGLSEELIDQVNELAKDQLTILVNFGSPYALALYNNNQAVLQAYEGDKTFQEAAAQALFGGFKVTGELPVSVQDRYQAGDGIKTSDALRFNYTLPERLGISSAFLSHHIDSLVQTALEKEATPGCQVFVAKEGNVIFNQGYGHYTYGDTQAVNSQTIYDIASITKIGATVPMVMQLYEEDRIDLRDSLGKYLNRYLDSIKRDLQLKELLTHQAGLTAWIPFYRYTLNDQGFCDSNYCYRPNSFYSMQVAEDLYLQRGYRDSIWSTIAESEMHERGSYNYSDLGFFYLKKVIEQFLDRPFRQYARQEFFRPLGMNRTVFKPLEQFPLSRIVPTEDDDYFRHQLVHGYVHDPAAAMLGGVAGHAGLFSTTHDFAKLMQMLLNEGAYGGKRYFDPATVQLFTSQQYEDNRKGLGFDKPEPDTSKVSPTGELASLQTFGHTGFTGTCIWADPKHDLIYGFFSNRVHPDADNEKLISMDFRTKIQDAIYRSFLDENAIEKRQGQTVQ